MNILIVSGFLGAGKTTFIKELIRRTKVSPVILENEYGDNSIDAAELRSSTSADAPDGGSGEKKLEILEFMEGCVCCTMKDSFVNSVLTVFSSLSPEYLIIEPTGVGKLSNIVGNLQPLLVGNISLLKPIVVVAPRSYHQNLQEWGDLYRDQVANAGIVVFSKCENESPEILAETEAAIKKINPNAEIISSHYTTQNDNWWRSCFSLTAENIELTESGSDIEGLSQLTLNNAGLDNPSQLITLLEDCLHGEFGGIVRAKGTIPVGGEFLRFDLADRLYSITDSTSEENSCVFIGRYPDKEKLRKRLGCLLAERKISLGREYVKYR